jgi:dolichol-phosphate mannosyltransferase
MTNILYPGSWITDEPTCYKVFRRDIIQSIPLRCTKFEFCPEVTAKVLKKGIRIVEVPIRYYPRSVEEGKKIKLQDGFDAIWTLLKYRFID